MADEGAADVSGLFTGEWSEPEEVAYTPRDLLLYAVGIGCGQAGSARYADLRYVYEQELNFAAFPTYPFCLESEGDHTRRRHSSKLELIPWARADDQGLLHAAGPSHQRNQRCWS
ncbi:unnamed protein product [Prorocentrum cordatum]|uniref:Peroxisomal multifunctional enzyme type 2-like N-terminal domain-containing protein n=1 Tax=Prorocentrum cordatum TaxID=2364126 RepID=A0ABN9S2Z4_9DINO|nr:unnamed protein product [Polarella glacialis]